MWIPRQPVEIRKDVTNNPKENTKTGGVTSSRTIFNAIYITHKIKLTLT